MALQTHLASEWLEANGLGGFASGTVGGQRTRRYHALLLTATGSGRIVLVNGFEAWVETPVGTTAISSQVYVPDIVHPDGATRLDSFTIEPWPRWTFQLPCGIRVEQELFVPYQSNSVALSWRVADGPKDATLVMRPFLSGRDYHSLMRENEAFRFESRWDSERITWHPFEGMPSISVHTNGQYHHEPVWYRNFLYTQERDRGLDHVEDLASPGLFRWKLNEGPAVWMATAPSIAQSVEVTEQSSSERYFALRTTEQQRRSCFSGPLERAADGYVVRSGDRKTVIAGYPWFTDWGRDTFIALRGLCLATARFSDAEEILVSWSAHVSQGMLPNRFPDHGGEPEYNSVDASLWYIIAVSDFLRIAKSKGHRVSDDHAERLQHAIDAILTGYAEGTRYGIHADDDGLLAAGAPGVQLTWMDAKVGDWVVTSRVGKPVEIQALWLNALWIGASYSDRWFTLFHRGFKTFSSRFWNEAKGCLHDVIDVDHEPGKLDDAIRPNQILAVGGLPIQLLDGPQARSVVNVVEKHLWTPLGLRSLSPDNPQYRATYSGNIWQRDGSYHQGTVWPWLVGPFIEAWVRVRETTDAVIEHAREQFVAPLVAHLGDAGLGHISEIADGDSPHVPRGCPFQAWSVGEPLRVQNVVLVERDRETSENGGVRQFMNKSSLANRASREKVVASITERIVQRTRGSIHDLRIELKDGRIVIDGRAPSSHMRQLAETAIREALNNSAAPHFVSQIKVANSK